ncbi:hypothetical protein DID76_03710 [Candidatus Marinamargulisbacteria bacterium SCGC AG-414-C22]|nr:hypothetical protein DID76_03710 [Candidatus Marinamargulisbacteria bacterium SCGC AG-414-C22]
MDTNESNVDIDLEYNDGLGDLLREREKLEFNWVKTATVLAVLIVLVVGGVSLLFKTGKEFIDHQAENSIKYEDKLISSIASQQQPANSPTKKEDINLPVNLTSENKNQVNKVTGTEKTTTQTITKDDLQPVVKNSNLSYKVIAGSFSSKKNATKQLNKLKNKGIDSFLRVSNLNSGSPIYKIQAGSFNKKSSAEKQQKTLKNKGFDSYLTTKF